MIFMPFLLPLECKLHEGWNYLFGLMMYLSYIVRHIFGSQHVLLKIHNIYILILSKISIALM